MLPFGVELGVGLLQKRVGGGTGLDVGTVVDELADREPARHLRHRAEMVTVVVRRDQVIDAGHAGVARRRDDPVGIPRGARPAVAGVDEQRLARRRHVR